MSGVNCAMAAPDAAGATRHDDETLDYVKVAVGREYGLSEGQARRLRGATVLHERRRFAEQEGSIGIGRGGGAAHVARPSTNEQINERLRAAAHLVTNRAELGVNLRDVL